MPARRPARLVPPALALLALALPALAPAATVGSRSSVIVAQNDPASPGPLSGTVVDTATIEDLADGLIAATADLGSGGSARGYITENGVTFGAVVHAPNQLPGDVVLARGGFVKVSVERYFRKVSDDATLRYYFSGFTLQAAYDREFSSRCPAGRNDCLQAGWRSEAGALKLDGTVVDDEAFFAEVGSNPDLPSGFYFAEQLPFFAFLDLQSRPDGITLQTLPDDNPAVSGVGIGELLIDDIAVGEIFRGGWVLTAWAYDGASDSGPGRIARAFVQDPLDPDLGVGFLIEGLEEVAAPVPLPAAAWLFATAFVPAMWRLRRRRG